MRQDGLYRDQNGNPIARAVGSKTVSIPEFAAADKTFSTDKPRRILQLPAILPSLGLSSLSRQAPSRIETFLHSTTDSAVLSSRPCKTAWHRLFPHFLCEWTFRWRENAAPDESVNALLTTAMSNRIHMILEAHS